MGWERGLYIVLSGALVAGVAFPQTSNKLSTAVSRATEVDCRLAVIQCCAARHPKRKKSARAFSFYSYLSATMGSTLVARRAGR